MWMQSDLRESVKQCYFTDYGADVAIVAGIVVRHVGAFWTMPDDSVQLLP